MNYLIAGGQSSRSLWSAARKVGQFYFGDLQRRWVNIQSALTRALPTRNKPVGSEAERVPVRPPRMPCASSKLSPLDFIGGFERLGIARVDGDA